MAKTWVYRRPHFRRIVHTAPKPGFGTFPGGRAWLHAHVARMRETRALRARVSVRPFRPPFSPPLVPPAGPGGQAWLSAHVKRVQSRARPTEWLRPFRPPFVPLGVAAPVADVEGPGWIAAHVARMSVRRAPAPYRRPSRPAFVPMSVAAPIPVAAPDWLAYHIQRVMKQRGAPRWRRPFRPGLMPFAAASVPTIPIVVPTAALGTSNRGSYSVQRASAVGWSVSRAARASHSVPGGKADWSKSQ